MTVAVAMLVAAVAAVTGGGVGAYAKLVSTRPATCAPSEFACTSSSSTSVAADEDDEDAAAVRCVPSIRYCDGRRDCPDGSDEPHDCTREFCNQR